MEVRLQDTCSDDQLHRLSYLRPRRASAGGRRELSLCRLNSRNSGDGSIYPVPGWTDPPVASLGAEPDGSPSRLKDFITRSV